MPRDATAQAIAGSVQPLSGFLFGKLYHLSYTKDMDEKEKKITNEKPVSLFPLGFKEAVAALLKVKPEPKLAKKPRKKSVAKQK